MTFVPRAEQSPVADALVLGLLALVVGTLVGALIAGIGTLIYLVILFPLGIAFASGIIIDIATRRLRIRNVPLEAAAGGLCAAWAYLVMHIVEYLLFRSSIASLIQAELSTVPTELLPEMIDAFLIDVAGVPGFVGYLLLSAREGLQLGSVFGVGASTPIRGIGVWIYWCIEALICIVPPVLILRSSNRPPLCAHCRSWYRATHVGSIQPSETEEFLTTLQAQRYEAASDLVCEPGDTDGLEVYLLGCSKCSDQYQVLTVDRPAINSSGHMCMQEVTRIQLIPEYARFFKFEGERVS